MEKLTDKKLKELGLKTYMLEPRTKTFGGIIVTKETEFEDVEEVDNTSEENGNYRKIKIEQSLKEFVLKTHIISELKIEGYEAKETKTTTQDLSLLGKEELLLIFVNDEGWGVPNGSVIKPEDAIKTLELIKNK